MTDTLLTVRAVIDGGARGLQGALTAEEIAELTSLALRVPATLRPELAGAADALSKLSTLSVFIAGGRHGQADPGLAKLADAAVGVAGALADDRLAGAVDTAKPVAALTVV